MLSVHNERAAATEFFSATFEILLREDETLVGSHEYHDEDEGSEDDEAVFENGGDIGGEGSGQVDPAVNVWGQIADTLWDREWW